MIIRALLLFALFHYSPPANANEVLRFKEPTSYKERLVVSSLTPQIPYLIAKTDLNDDAIDEYIIKPKACTSTHFCSHDIVALHKYKPTSIGNFNTYRIIVKNTHSYGVRDLQIYSNQHNNFSHTTAHWNPFSSQYETKQK